jgi:hypothetical protein
MKKTGIDDRVEGFLDLIWTHGVPYQKKGLNSAFFYLRPYWDLAVGTKHDVENEIITDHIAAASLPALCHSCSAQCPGDLRVIRYKKSSAQFVFQRHPHGGIESHTPHESDGFLQMETPHHGNDPRCNAGNETGGDVLPADSTCPQRQYLRFCKNRAHAGYGSGMA